MFNRPDRIAFVVNVLGLTALAAVAAAPSTAPVEPTVVDSAPLGSPDAWDGQPFELRLMLSSDELRGHILGLIDVTAEQRLLQRLARIIGVNGSPSNDSLLAMARALPTTKLQAILRSLEWVGPREAAVCLSCGALRGSPASPATFANHQPGCYIDTAINGGPRSAPNGVIAPVLGSGIEHAIPRQAWGEAYTTWYDEDREK